MREIKFRAWDKRNNWMDDEIYIDSKGNVYDTPSVTYDTPHKEIELITNYILMQFTGLQDKNGKDVYENDIVKYWYRPWNTGGMGGEYKTGYIIFSDGCFKMMEIEDIMERDIHIPDDIEIIGNIHENPELMGER